MAFKINKNWIVLVAALGVGGLAAWGAKNYLGSQMAEIEARDKNKAMVRVVVAKTDLAIATRYTDLVLDRELAERIFSIIKSEWQRTVDMLRAITGTTAFLEDNPALARSIRNRFPYLDPLNHLQIDLLRRYRAGQTDERTKRAIHLTINGLAAGLRNSG